MKHNYKKTLVLGLVTLGGMLCLNNSSGPGLNNQAATGAPFNSGTCTNCHTQGTSFAPTVSLQLLSGGSPVTSYWPNTSYTLRITRSANTSFNNLINAGFGFQLTSAVGASNTNLNNWGTLPSNTANRTVLGRNYIEHTTKLNKSITQLDIPWTSPASGSGQVKFYIALNSVNGNGASSGDHVVNTSLLVSQDPLPVTWLYFRGREEQGKVLLEWATSSEVNNGFFTLEKSKDGNNFSELSRMAAKTDAGVEHIYSFTDEAPFAGTYYRVKQTDLDGQSHYFKTIFVRRGGAVQVSHYEYGNSIIINLDAAKPGLVQAEIFAMDGRKVLSRPVITYEGLNSIQLEKPEAAGIYLIHLSDAQGSLYDGKFLVR